MGGRELKRDSEGGNIRERGKELLEERGFREEVFQNGFSGGKGASAKKRELREGFREGRGGNLRGGGGTSGGVSGVEGAKR